MILPKKGHRSFEEVQKAWEEAMKSIETVKSTEPTRPIRVPGPILFPSPEMERLRMMLDYNGLEWADKSDNKIPDMAIERTHLYFGETLCSIIHGYGTYGGYNLFTERDEGLLELMCEKVNGGEPLGELTADDVIVIIEGIRQGTL